MIKSGSFSYAGNQHGLLPERNEDVVLERDCGTHKIVVLYDGAGSCINGKAALPDPEDKPELLGSLEDDCSAAWLIAQQTI